MYDLLLQKYQERAYSEIISIATSNNITPANDPASANIVAAAHFSLGQVRESIELLSVLEESLGDDDSFLSLYGAALRRSGDFKASSLMFKRALAQSPDNIFLKNNYANLLIDLEKYSDAKDLLLTIVSLNPDYKDAVENLQRVESLLLAKSQSNDLYSSNPATVSSSSRSIDSLLDPLLLAFDSQEVQEHGRLSNLPELKAAVTNTDSRSIGLEKLKLANKAVSEDNLSFALEICSKSYIQLGCDSNVFDCVSDAYLKSNRFLEAEISILHSLAFSPPSMKHYINLTSLASMRLDFQLAEFYYQKAMCLDSTDPNLANLRKLLDRRKISKASSKFLFEKLWEFDVLVPTA